MIDDTTYMLSIVDAIQQIESYTQEGKGAFLSNRMAQDAVLRNLEIIGEATKHLSEGIREAYSHVPWRRIAGLRDVLIHDYLGVDLEEVWGVIEKHLPELKRHVETICSDLGILPES